MNSVLSYLADQPHASQQAEAAPKLASPHGYDNDKPPAEISQDFVFLNQRVAEARDFAGRVELMFIEERAERRQAVNDLWQKLKEIQNDMRHSKPKSDEQQPPGKPQVADSVSALSPADKAGIMQHGVELARIEKELANHRAQMQELKFMLEDQSHGTGHNTHAGLRGEHLANPPDKEELEKKHASLENEVASLRDMWLEAQLGLSMCMVRSSRIALRSAELSVGGRKAAVENLEEKEADIVAQIEALRKDRALSAATQMLLSDPLEESGALQIHDPVPPSPVSATVF